MNEITMNGIKVNEMRHEWNNRIFHMNEITMNGITMNGITGFPFSYE